MRKFVVGYLDYFDNEMKLEILNGESKEKALQDYFFKEDAEAHRDMSVEDIESYAFDSDSAIGIIEV